MADLTTILVPIRYPLTDRSTQTLEAAVRLAHDHTPADLRVLHVNVYQDRDNTHTRELDREVSSALDGLEASVTTRQGFLVEEEILNEAMQTDTDIIVVGANQQATWQKILSRLLQNSPAIGSFLRENATADTEIIEVDTAAETPIAEPV